MQQQQISNKLRKKTPFIVFYTPNKPIPDNLSETDTMIIKIKLVNMIKYLAVIFDEELKWSNHIDYVCDIEFDIEIDGAAGATNLEIMQKKLMKLILKLDMRTPTYYLILLSKF